jgi:hypothetical protein
VYRGLGVERGRVVFRWIKLEDGRWKMEEYEGWEWREVGWCLGGLS